MSRRSKNFRNANAPQGIGRWIPLWAVPVVIVLAIGTVWLRLSILRTTYEVNQANKLIRNAQNELDAAELRVAQLRAPRRLEFLARTKFHLAPPDAGQIIRMEPTER